MSKSIKLLTMLLSVAVMSSCGNNQQPPQRMKYTAEEAQVISYYVSESSMRYMVVRKQNFEGIGIVNLTKDSLECEFYKSQLTK